MTNRRSKTSHRKRRTGRKPRKHPRKQHSRKHKKTSQRRRSSSRAGVLSLVRGPMSVSSRVKNWTRSKKRNMSETFDSWKTHKEYLRRQKADKKSDRLASKRGRAHWRRQLKMLREGEFET